MKQILYFFLLCSPLFSFAQHPEIPDRPENLQQHLLDRHNATNLMDMQVTVLDSLKSYTIQSGMNIPVFSNINFYNNQGEPLEQGYFYRDFNTNELLLITDCIDS